MAKCDKWLEEDNLIPHQSINGRYSMANSWGANYFVSIHCNAADDGSANGTETLIYAKFHIRTI